jgi:hypothetical protein
MKDAEQKHRSNSYRYEQSPRDASNRKEDSFKPVQSPTESVTETVITEKL